jgi:hypothetical protein
MSMRHRVGRTGEATRQGWGGVNVDELPGMPGLAEYLNASPRSLTGIATVSTAPEPASTAMPGAGMAILVFGAAAAGAGELIEVGGRPGLFTPPSLHTAARGTTF